MKYVMILVLTLMSGCNNQSPVVPKAAVPPFNELVFYEDSKNGVTCYRVVGIAGLSCVKTGLSVEDQLKQQQLKSAFGLEK